MLYWYTNFDFWFNSVKLGYNNFTLYVAMEICPLEPWNRYNCEHLCSKVKYVCYCRDFVITEFDSILYLKRKNAVEEQIQN